MRRKRNEYRSVPYRTPREERDTQRGEAGLILRFARRYVWPHRGSVFLCIILASLNACSVYLQAYYGRIVVDDILMIDTGATDTNGSHPVDQIRVPDRAPTADRQTDGAQSETRRFSAAERPPWASRRLLAMFLIYAGTIILLYVANLLAQRLQFRVAKHITSRLREDMHEKILSLSALYHQTHTPGRLMARILSDVDIVQRQLMGLIVTASSQFIMFLAGFSILLVLDKRVALVVALSMVPYVLLMSRVRKEVRRTSREIRQTNACLWSLAAQKLDAIRAVLSYARQRMEYLCFHRLSACLLRDTLHQQRVGAGMNRSAQLISAFTTRGIFLYCTVMVLDRQMSLGMMMYIFGASTNLFMPIIHLTQIALQVSQLLVVLQRLTYVFETRVEVAESPHASPFPAPIETGIQLRKITFAYQEDLPPVLQDISLNIRSGRWVCILGPSGSGKSSLINLIARLYDPTEGEITVDGIPLANIRFRSLRKHMALVPQEAQILSGTIRDNIIYGRQQATPTQIMAAAKAADCHDFIMELPVKYETIVGEKGMTLSGGQRQRISIARALLTDPEVLLLDDCTSALDANTEQKLQETLARLMQGKTAVIVSQRVSMAMRCHRIVIVEQGRITESGTHEKLIAAGGYYAKLHEQQTR